MFSDAWTRVNDDVNEHKEIFISQCYKIKS